jgi:hypothetical protein
MHRCEQQGFTLLIFCIVSCLSQNFTDMSFMQGLYTNHNKIHVIGFSLRPLNLQYKVNKNPMCHFCEEIQIIGRDETHSLHSHFDTVFGTQI